MVSDGMPHIDDPRTIREATFSTSFRGFDQLEVRAFLQTLARQLGDIEDLRVEAQAKVEQAELELEAAKEIDESVLMARLGEDATRILQTARDQASERLAQAEQDVAELRSRVDSEVAAIRAAADEQAKETRNELDIQQASLDAAIASEESVRAQHRSDALAQAQREADDLLAQARAKGDETLAEAREEGRAMVAEARIVRERILADLSRRRTNAKVQLEQLRAGRQRLLDAVDLASVTVADVNRELENALPEARLAAETAGLTVPSPASVAEIESEIESARLVGNPFVTSAEVDQALAEGSVGSDTNGEPVEYSTVSEKEEFEDADAESESGDLASTRQKSAGSAPFDIDSEDQLEDDFDSPGVVLAELGDDRSSMFRRKKNLPPVADELPRDQVPTIELEADFEQVRALDPTIELEAVVDEFDDAAEVAPEVPELELVEDLPDEEPLADADERLVEVAPEGAEDSVEVADVELEDVELEDVVLDVDEEHDEPEPELETEPEPELEAEALAPVVSIVADPVEHTEHESEPVEETEPEPEVAQGDSLDSEDTDSEETDQDDDVIADGAPDDDVDALFDRLRADREQRVAHASAVLAAAEDPVAGIETAELETAELETAELETAELETAEPEAPAAVDEPESTPALEAVPELAAEVEQSDEEPAEDERSEQEPAEEQPVEEEPLTSERFQNLEQALAERRASLAELEKSCGRKLKRTLAEEQNELLDLVRRGEATAATSIETLVGDIATHSSRYVDAVVSQLQIAAAAGAASVGGQAPPIDVEAARSVVSDEWLSSMRHLVERVFADGDDPDDIIEHLRSLYREVKGQRMSLVASSLVVSAYNVGVNEGLAAERTVRWELAPDSDCGQDCTANLVAGAITAGTLFPSGHLHPPAAAGCRCLLVAEDDVRSKKIS